MMGIALSMISGGDVALLYDSHLAAGGGKNLGTTVLGNMKLAEQTGAAVSALLGGVVATLSYRYLLWANAILNWIPTLLVLGVAEPPTILEKAQQRPEEFQGRSCLPTGAGRHDAARVPQPGRAGGPPGS